jgi:hypothetical protein
MPFGSDKNLMAENSAVNINPATSKPCLSVYSPNPVKTLLILSCYPKRFEVLIL